MIQKLIRAAITAWCAAGVFSLATAQDTAVAKNADELAIRASAEAFEKAFAAGDAQALAAAFTEDGELTDETGQNFKGREAIAQQYEALRAGRSNPTVDVEIDSIKFLSPDVAVESGTSHGLDTGSATKYTAIHVKRNGQWLMSHVDERANAVVTSKQRLAPLAFLVGKWESDLGGGRKFSSQCEWTTGDGFLKRTFSVQEGDRVLSAGTQVIGYDPLTSQIVSWTFDLNGGYGHEIWRYVDGRWEINASSVLPDGSTALATNYFTRGNNDSFTWQSAERSLNGQLLPDTATVRVRRAAK